MTQNPLVSVVVPIFQIEQYLAETLDGVLAQSFGDWELIVVDDGSTDDGPRIARRYAAADPARIRVIEHPDRGNHGISASRNLGVAHARGRWIAPLDGDDVWLPEKLACQVRIASAHPEVGLVASASLYWHSWEGPEPDRVVQIGAAQDTVHQPPALLERLYPLGDGAAPPPSSFLVRADVLRQVGGSEEAVGNAYEDQALLVKLYLATPVHVGSACLVRYRQRSGSVMAGLSSRRYHAERRRFLEWFAGYLEQSGQHEDVRRRVRDAMWPYRHPFLHMVRRVGRRVARAVARRAS